MPRCAEPGCGRWRPERLAPRWATGIRFNAEWYCSADCVEQAARAGLEEAPATGGSTSVRSRLRLGVLLRHLRVLTETDLARALDSQRTSGRRLGAELMRLGLVDADDVLKALAAQNNVSYLPTFDVARVTSARGFLPPDSVRALGLVPFEVDQPQERVRVICGAPVPRRSVRALAKLTGWTPDVYLVHDEAWDRALDAYGAAAAESDGAAVTHGGVDAVAAVVSRTAHADRSVTMRHVTCGEYTFVRVDGARQTSHLVIPAMPRTGAGWAGAGVEDACQAEPIAH